MVSSYISGPTIDDLMRSVLDAISARGHTISPSRGSASELTGVMLELTNPRARLSRSESRGKPFSCLGELCWYLSGTDDANFIGYYLRHYQGQVGSIVYGAYGPRLFRLHEINQVENVIGILRTKPDSRQAVIQLFEAADIDTVHDDVPCTCTIQFLNRGQSLDVVVNMRSNDAYLGLPHDIFCFTMLQEIVARSVDSDVGTYKHVVGSLHLYDERKGDTETFLREGWQGSEPIMPEMPQGDPWPAIRSLLEAEERIRGGEAGVSATLTNLDPYWMDLVLLLDTLRCSKAKDRLCLERTLEQITGSHYGPYVQSRIDGLA